jgi:hypothetical protein
MAKGIEIASTTDSQADIERAIGLEPSSQALNEERERMEAQAAPPPEQAPPPEPEQPKPPQKTKAEKRIDKLVFEREEARRETEALKARVAELERVAANGHSESTEPDRSRAEPAVEAPTEQPEPAARRQPSQEQHVARVRDARSRYSDWDVVMTQAQNKAMAGDVLESVERLDNSADVVYFLARSDEYREQLNKLPPQVQQKEVQRISADLMRTQGIVEDIQAFLSKKPDVAQLNERAPQLRDEIAGAVRQATMEVPNPGELTYHLLSHPQIIQKLNQLNPRQAFTETMRESARLELTSNGHSRPVSSAPAPIQPLRGTASSTADPDEMDFQDFKAWRERNKRVYGVRR